MLGDDAVEGVAIGLLDRLHEPLQHGRIRSDADDPFGEQTRVEIGDRFWRATQLEAAEDALLDADPFADETTERCELQPLQRLDVRFRILRAERFVDGGECFLVLRQLADNLGPFQQIAENVEL